MPRKDKAADAAYQKRYLSDPVNKARRAETTKKNREANKAFRLDLLNKFPCVCCGDPDPTVIDWHHVFPEDKVFEIKWGIMRGHEPWWNEVLKCVPVCCNCQRKIHKNKLCLLPQKLLTQNLHP